MKQEWTADQRLWANPDGTHTLESGTAINFRDAAGDWNALDLTLVEVSEGEFAPMAAPSQLSLLTNAADGTIASLKGDDATIALRTVLPAVGAMAGDQIEFGAAPGLPGIFVRATDLGFEFGATFADALTSPIAEFGLDAGGLTAELADDGMTINLLKPDAGETDPPLGFISAPLVQDEAAIEASVTDITVGLVRQNDGTYLLTYSISPVWLEAKERAFPVTLDPSVCIRSGDTGCDVNTNTVDIWYGSGQPSTWVTSSTSSFLHVGKYVATGDPWGQTRAALYFSGASLPDGAVITDATLRVREAHNYSGATTARIYARMIKKQSGWQINTSSATWDSLAAAVRTGYDSPQYAPCNSGATDCNLNLDVTSAVRGWYTRRGIDWRHNAGFQLRYATEGSTSAYYETSFYRYTDATVTNRPQLTITYEAGGFALDFDPALGPTYAPSAMVAGQATVLPIKITNRGTPNFTTADYRAGYRFFNVKNNSVAGSGVGTLPAAINAGATSAVFGLSVTPPTTLGQYILRLDVVKVVNGVNVFYSDWAKPTKFYSRDKKVLTSDSTRWVGSSIMERDEFGTNVVNGQGSRGAVKTVATGDGGELGINLWSHNLSYAGDSGISVADRIPLTVTYGYNSKDAASCSGYLGILDACGWFTNWDERIAAGATDDAYTYYDPSGTAHLTDSDVDGQLVGPPVQLSRKRVTLFDENRPTSGGTYVTAATEGIPDKSGTHVVRVNSNTTTTLGGFVDGASSREISLNTYRWVNFSLRTKGSPAAASTAICFEIDNKTQNIQKWICLVAGPPFDTGTDRIAWTADDVSDNWSSHGTDLWGVVSGTVGTFTGYGDTTDDYFIKTVKVMSSSGSNNGYTYLDGLELTPMFPWRMDITSNITSWTTGSSTYTTEETISSYHGAVQLTGPVSCTNAACFESFGVTENISGTNYLALDSLSSAPFLSWWWKKAGGQAAALTVCVTDLRNDVDGEITYYAGARPPATVSDCPGLSSSDRHFVQVSPHIPGHFARVIRNVPQDARQILNFFKDDAPGTTSASPPTTGPSPDNVAWTGLTIDPVDGQYLLFTHAELNSGPLPSGINRYADWNANKDDLNYGGVISPSDGPMDDFVAEYPDGTFHFFNRDGLLTRIVTKQGAELDLQWTYGGGTGPGNYTLAAIHAPSDNTDDGGTTVYRHYLAVATTTITGFTQTTFTEKLGTAASPVTGRRADFYVATGTGTTWGVGDLVKVSPARHNASTCGSAPSGCADFEYTNTTGHLVKRVADPRWDGSTSGVNDARLEVTWSGSDPMAVLDRSHGSAALLKVNAFDRGRATSPKYLRALWQDAAASAAGYAMHEDLSPDGSVVVEYIRQGPCTGGDCTANKPNGADTDLLGRRLREYAFDGLSHVNSVTTYRCPGVAVGGCTGTTELLTRTRRATNAGAKVENYIDALASSQVAWEQSADQYFASLRDSDGTNPDLYRTEYTYNAVNAPIVERSPAFNRITDYPGTAKASEGLTHYWRLGEAASPLVDTAGSTNGTGSNVTYGQPGALARDANAAPSFNGTSSRITAAAAIPSSAYTLAGWVKLNATVTSDKGIFGRYASNSGVLVYVRGSTGALTLAHNAGRVFGDTKLELGSWYHVAATWDGARAYLYLDGDLVGASAITGAPTAGATSFEIGSFSNGAASTFLNGWVDEVATRNVAVDQSVLRAEFQAGRGVAIVRTETSYGAHGPMSSWTHLDADPSQRAVQLIANGDFEVGLSGWNTAHGAVLTDPATVQPQSGQEAVALTGTNYTDQLAQAVPGQRIHFQLAGKASAAGALVTYRVDYWQVSTSSWQPLVAEASISATSWTTAAHQVTVPASNATGLLKVTLRNGGTGSAYADAVLVVTAWQAWIYKAPTQYYHGGSGRDAYIGDGLVEYVKTISPAGTGTRSDRLYYDVEPGHAAIWPRRTVANYGNGTPGPGADDDVTTTLTYDGWGRVLTSTDPDGVVATTVYHATNLTDVLKTKDGLNNETEFGYDAVGNLLSTKTPLGRVSSSTYDSRNQRLTSTDPAGVVSKTDYNGFGQATASWANWVNGVVESTDGDDTDDLLTTRAFDRYGRVTQQDVDCGSVAACTTGGLDARTVTSYDLLGNIVETTVSPGEDGTGAARVTANHFETYGTSPKFSRVAPSGIQLPIGPGSSAPFCPGSTAVRCNSASVWTFNSATVSSVDMTGRSFATTDAYGVVTLTDRDLAGRPVTVTAGYSAGATPDSDTNVPTRTEYNLAGDPIVSWDAFDRRVDRSYDDLGRVTEVSHRDTAGVEFLHESMRYLPSGRVSRTFDGSAWTKTLYDGAGRATRTIANYDPFGSGSVGMTLEAFEGDALTGWSSASSGWFTTASAAGIGTDADPTGALHDSVAPSSGRGRLHLTTHASSPSTGAWLDLSGPWFEPGHTYKAAFDVVASAAGLNLTAYLGKDQSGASYGQLGITTSTSWTRHTVSWTTSGSENGLVHFAITKPAAGTAHVYLDNLVIWDTTSGWIDGGIVSSVSAYNADGEIAASVLPPGDPATERPLVTTVGFDAVGRNVITTVNGASGAYASAVLSTAGVVAYTPLDERTGTSVTDKAGTALTASGSPKLAVAGGIDEARTAIGLAGGTYLSRATSATQTTTNVSMEAWLRTDAGNPSQTVVVAGNGTATNGWGIGIDANGKASGFTISSSTFTTLPASASAPINDGRWHHLVLTRGVSSWSLTIDGQAWTLTNSSPGTPGAGFSIGALAGGTRPFTGEVDEVSVYTADISGSTASAHWAAGRRTDAVTALTSRMALDRLGRITESWDAKLVRAKAGYDRLGNQIETVLNYQNGDTAIPSGVDDDDVRSTFAYSVVGELIGYCPAEEVNAGGCNPATSGNVQAWHYEFDKLGRQVKTIAPVNTSVTPLATSETVYQAGGRVEQTCSYPAGQSCGAFDSRHVDFTYDDLGRLLTQKTWDRGGGSDTLKFTKTMTWLKDGAPSTIAEGSTTFKYEYDTAGRPLAFKNDTTSTTLTGWTYTTSTNLVASRLDGSLGTTTFGYDWARRVDEISATFVTGTVTKAYRLDGLLATQAFPSSITETLSYDAAKRPTGISLGSAGSLSQAFDRAGKVTSDGRTLTGISGDAGNNSQSFNYDDLGRLTSSSLSAASRTYTYDLDGNRLSKAEGGTTTTYTYDRTDQLIKQTIGGVDKVTSFDKFGNLLQAADNANAYTTYAFDEANRLTSITPPAPGDPATFTVDPLDRHAQRTVGAATDTYGYVGPTETAFETGSSGTRSLLDLDGSRLAVKNGSTVAWVLFDLHGSVVALCPAGASALSDAYRYDGWGQTIATAGSSANPWKYRGLLGIDPSSDRDKLYDMGARDYAPGTGTFTQLDSVQGWAANPMTMNRFLYALANPATLIDPDGHTPAPCEGCPPDYDISNDIEIWQDNQQKAKQKEKQKQREEQERVAQQRQDTGCRKSGVCSDTEGGAPPGYTWSHFEINGVHMLLPVGCHDTPDGNWTGPDCDSPAATTGNCLSASAQVGIMGGASLCVVEGHVQLTGQAGASTGVGLFVGVGHIESDVPSASNLGGFGAGFGTSGGGGVVAGFDQSWSNVDGEAVGTGTTYVGLGGKVSPELAMPGEIHAFGSFTIDFNDFVDWLIPW